MDQAADEEFQYQPTKMHSFRSGHHKSDTRSTGVQLKSAAKISTMIGLITQLLYSKTGVYRGIHYFLNFALKHRFWVLVRTASSKNMKNITKIGIFTSVKNRCILHRHVCLIVHLPLLRQTILNPEYNAFMCVCVFVDSCISQF